MCVREWGSPNSDDWRKSLALFPLCGYCALHSSQKLILADILASFHTATHCTLAWLTASIFAWGARWSTSSAAAAGGLQHGAWSQQGDLESKYLNTGGQCHSSRFLFSLMLVRAHYTDNTRTYTFSISLGACCASVCSGAPGSRIWDPVPFWPLDSGSRKGKKLRSGSGNLEKIFLVKILTIFYSDADPGFRNLLDPGSGIEKIRIRDQGETSRISNTGKNNKILIKITWRFAGVVPGDCSALWILVDRWDCLKLSLSQPPTNCSSGSQLSRRPNSRPPTGKQPAAVWVEFSPASHRRFWSLRLSSLTSAAGEFWNSRLSIGKRCRSCNA